MDGRLYILLPMLEGYSTHLAPSLGSSSGMLRTSAYVKMKKNPFTGETIITLPLKDCNTLTFQEVGASWFALLEKQIIC